MADKKTIWSDAAVPGLVLGGISTIYFIINTLISRIDPGNTGAALMGSAADMILWAAKFILCIILMKKFMKARSFRQPEADNSDIFKFGCAIALLSAIVYSAFYLATVQFIFPDTFDKILDLLRDNPMIDAASMEQLENLFPKLPSMTFFVNFFYCWLFGTILSAIFSRNIPPVNPFAGHSTNNTDEQ